MTQTQQLLAACGSWRNAWKPADRRPIHEWARENIIFHTGTITGPFSTRQSQWMEDIFHSLQDLKIRRVRLRKGIKIGGTLMAEVYLQWIICNDPGNVSWTMQTESEMEDHLKSRLWPLMIDGCRATFVRLPPVGDKRTINRIYFGSSYVAFNSATKGQQQSKDVRYKINDETWLPCWIPVYQQAIGRTSAYERIGLSKIFDVSQAGVKGDVEDTNFLEGHQADLYVLCRSCGKPTPLSFDVEREDKSRAGVIFPEAKQADGYFNVARACEVCRYHCVACNSEEPESEKLRQQWFSTEHWVPKNINASPAYKSYHVETLSAKKFPSLVEQFCNAYNARRRGFDDGMINFCQQELARPWIEKGESIDLRHGTLEHPYRYSDYTQGEIWPGEEARALTIDRQKDHFWVLIMAWKKTGDCRQLFFGRVQRVEEVFELQKKYRVPYHHVMEDAGYDEPSVLNDCVRFHEKDRTGWVALRGEKQKEFLHEGRDGKKEKKYYSVPQRILHGTDYVFKIYFSADNIKDMLAPRIRGLTPCRFDLPTDVSLAYVDHVNAEQKIELYPGQFGWQPVPKGKPNHGWDCTVMQLVFALVKGFVQPPTMEEIK